MSPLSDLEPARIVDYLLSSPTAPLVLGSSSGEGWEALDGEPPPLPRRRRRSVALLAAAALLLACGLGVDAGEDLQATPSMGAERSSEGTERSEKIDDDDRRTREQGGVTPNLPDRDAPGGV